MEWSKHFSTVDMHTAGEPLRIITGGLPPIKGKTMLEKRAYVLEHMDSIRRLLMHEPRGHGGMYGCIMTPPVEEGSDFGVLFMHNEGYSTMCGHGIIAVVTYAFEMGILEAKAKAKAAAADSRQKVVIDTPAGQVVAYAQVSGTKVESVAFDNVGSFVYKENVVVRVSGVDVRVDIAYGGAFYAVVEAADLGMRVNIDHLNEIHTWGKSIKKAVESELEVRHPLEMGIRGIYGVIISDRPEREGSDLRNVTVFADGQIDRSPCGTGTCARMAVLRQKGKLAQGERFVHESIIGSQFVGEMVSEISVSPYAAIVPRIQGRAFITGIQQFVVDPSDPLHDGFLLG